MQKMKKIGLIIASILLLNCFHINCYATTVPVPVTKENLKEALETFIDLGLTEEHYEFDITDTDINIIGEDETYRVTYDLTENPKFSARKTIEEGMTYEEFLTQNGGFEMIPKLFYMAVASIQGVSVADSSSYFSWSYSQTMSEAPWVDEDGYIIIDDSNPSVTKDITAENVIYVSEFGEKVMDYVNELYENKRIIEDSSTEFINSYVIEAERVDVTETSCRILGTLTVNLDADFSKLDGFYERLTSSADDENDGENNDGNNDENNNENDNEDNNETNNENTNTQNNIIKDNTVAGTILPEAGLSTIICIIIFLSICSITIFRIKLKKYKDIE